MGSIKEKNQRPKISCYCPLKAGVISTLQFGMMGLFPKIRGRNIEKLQHHVV
jgi:hypothetical protein